MKLYGDYTRYLLIFSRLIIEASYTNPESLSSVRANDTHRKRIFDVLIVDGRDCTRCEIFVAVVSCSWFLRSCSL